jgi:hypothetical protein
LTIVQVKKKVVNFTSHKEQTAATSSPGSSGGGTAAMSASEAPKMSSKPDISRSRRKETNLGISKRKTEHTFRKDYFFLLE